MSSYYQEIIREFVEQYFEEFHDFLEIYGVEPAEAEKIMEMLEDTDEK